MTGLSGRLPGHVLVVERDMIVGMNLAEDLKDLGCRVSGPFIRSSDVLPLLTSDAPDAAILDLELRDGMGLDVARALRAKGVPFVFFSGASERRRQLEVEFGAVPWIDKPAETNTIVSALRKVPVAAG